MSNIYITQSISLILLVYRKVFKLLKDTKIYTTPLIVGVPNYVKEGVKFVFKSKRW